MLRIAYADIFAHNLPEGHRFPMAKYELIPQQLLHEGVVGMENFFDPKEVPEQDILRVHKEDYWIKLKTLGLTASEIRKIGFPLNKELIVRECKIAQGTILCAKAAIDYGVALNVAGGTHHAFTDRGEGFCLLNDFAIAAAWLLDQGLVQKVMIVDLDVHQGNGTAEIFKDDDRVFTFSMHGADNYPLQKEQSDLDIPLVIGMEDATYLQLLEDKLVPLIDQECPDFIFYLSGVDVLSTDRYGKLSLSMDGCRLRDEKVFELCNQHSIPVAVSMGGGYSPDIADIVTAHCNTFKAAVAEYG